MQELSTFKVYSASAGSGKTFTLVKAYLSIVLSRPTPDYFKRILAITFTNKAALEMKQRIIENLLHFTKEDKAEGENMFMAIADELQIANEVLEKRAGLILHSILQNYTAFGISTIDSFTNKLIKSFAFDLNMSSDFDVVLDTESLMQQTVDELISKIGIDQNLTRVAIQYARQKTLDDRSWDISLDLLPKAKMLQNEIHLLYLEALKSKNLDDFLALQDQLKLEQKKFERVIQSIGKQGLDLMNHHNLQPKYFSSSTFPNLFLKVVKCDFDTLYNINFGGNINKSLEAEHLYSKSSKIDVQAKSILDELTEDFKQLVRQIKEAFESNFGGYILNHLVLKELVPLALTSSLNATLESIKEEQNIKLNSEFNSIISEHLKHQPAAFIFEKIGERYKHFFIDEMQDTSELQWQNLIPLIENALAGEHASAMLVGDVKQSIYRWRGGKAEQFLALATEEDEEGNPFVIDKEVYNLPTNYRSYSEIISFNNQLFTFLAKYFKEPKYEMLFRKGNQQQTTSKKGGYVEVSLVDVPKGDDKYELVPERVLKHIHELGQQFSLNEICILVRKNKHALALADYLTNHGVAVESSESMLLSSSNDVQFIINILRILYDDEHQEARINVLYFLYDHLELNKEKHDFLNNLVHQKNELFFDSLRSFDVFYSESEFHSSPLYEAVESIIRSFKLDKESNAYLQFFLDFVLEFENQSHSKKSDFLTYWEEKKEKVCVVGTSNDQAVKIMTIHKSKGLEFPVVLFAFDVDMYDQNRTKLWVPLDREATGFDDFLVGSVAKLEHTSEKGKNTYLQSVKDLELDGFNMLYVALTRAKEQLFLVLDKNSSRDRIKWYSQFIQLFLEQVGGLEKEPNRFTFGNEKRVSEMPTHGAKTELLKDFYSISWRDHQLEMVTQNTALLDDDRQEKINYGKLIHSIMADIISVHDVGKAIDLAISKGILAQSSSKDVKSKIEEIVNHQLLSAYFQDNQDVITERELINAQGELLIPDRLNFNHNKVTIIDYKTGKEELSHQLQLKKYQDALEAMDYEVIENILIYLSDEITIKKVN